MGSDPRPIISYCVKNLNFRKMGPNSIQYNTISFIGKTKKVKVQADTAATWDHYTIGLRWIWGKLVDLVTVIQK